MQTRRRSGPRAERGRGHVAMVALALAAALGLVGSGVYTVQRVAGGSATTYQPAQLLGPGAGPAAGSGGGATVTAGGPVRASARAGACPAAAELSTREALAQTLMLGVPSPTRRQLRDLLAGEAPLGGLFLHGDGKKVLTDGRLKVAKKAAVRPMLAADDEGGRVQRLEFADSMPSARDQKRTMTPAEVRDLAADRGAALRRYGITVDLAPVVDISSQRSGEVIGDRSYSADPATALRYARAFAAGLQEAGVLPVLKHFPGHGRAKGDSHEGTATTPKVASLRERDWKPYRALSDSGAAVMMGHLRVPGLSSKKLPSSVDPAVYRALREEIGFDGLVITDELASMAAVADRFGLRAAVRRALAAGADMALFLGDPDEVRPLLRGLTKDVRAGKLDADRVREAAGRVVAAKDACG